MNSPSDRSLSERIFIQADDLTGACDTGAQWAKRGLRTEVFLGGPFGFRPGSQVTVVDTDSRTVSPEEASRRIRSLTEITRKGEFSLFFKKMDSTLRGHPGRELDALLEASHCKWAVIAPAFPGQKRALVGGRLVVGGAPPGSEESREASSAIEEGVDLIRLLERQSRYRSGLIDIGNVREGGREIAEALRRHRAEGTTHCVCDAEEEEHLVEIVEAAFEIPEKVLWAGSAGLARVLAARGGRACRPPEQMFRADGRPRLFVVGSRNPVSRSQIAQLLSRGKARLFEVGMKPEEDRELTRRARRQVRESRAVVLAMPTGELPAGKAQELLGRLAGIASALFRSGDVSVVVASGGETARRLLDEVGCQRLCLLGEMAAGVAVSSWPERNLHLISKAGGFGERDILVNVNAFLEGKGAG